MKGQTTQISYCKHFTCSSLIHFLISYMCCQFVPSYGYQSYLINNSPEVLKFLANFDGYHYITNNYSHLPNFAFLPGFSVVAHYIYESMPYPFLILGTINKIFFWFSISYLQKICHHLKLTSNQQQKCILLFIYSPAAVFFHSIYSEPLYTLLTLAFIQNQFKKQSSIVISCLLLSISIFVRSTTLFLLPVIGVPILYHFYESVMKRNIKEAIQYFIKGSFILIIAISSFMIYLFWAYQTVCKSYSPVSQCSRKYFINIYSYVQDNYWSVGFLAYFKLSNIVFILIGLPSILFSIMLLSKPKNLNQIGLQFSFWILLFITVTMTNLQSSTRFLCSHPAFFINASTYFFNKNCNLAKLVFYKIFKLWQICYFYVGIILFSLQFPWT